MDANERRAAAKRKWREANKEKVRSYNASYRARNLERIRENDRAYHLANREVKNAGRRLRRASNVDQARESEARYREENRERIRESNRRSKRKDIEQTRERGRLSEMKRRATKAGNGTFRVTKREIQRILSSPCANCGVTSGVHVDHIIPISRGGRHSIGNLQALCASCNLSKGPKLYSEFRLSRRLLARSSRGGDSLS